MKQIITPVINFLLNQKPYTCTQNKSLPCQTAFRFQNITCWGWSDNGRQGVCIWPIPVWSRHLIWSPCTTGCAAPQKITCHVGFWATSSCVLRDPLRLQEMNLCQLHTKHMPSPLSYCSGLCPFLDHFFILFLSPGVSLLCLPSKFYYIAGILDSSKLNFFVSIHQFQSWGLTHLY